MIAPYGTDRPWSSTHVALIVSVCIDTEGDGGGGHWLVWMEWCPSGWLVCLPLLIFPCTIKSRSFLLAPAHPGVLKKGRKMVVVWYRHRASTIWRQCHCYMELHKSSQIPGRLKGGSVCTVVSVVAQLWVWLHSGECGCGAQWPVSLLCWHCVDIELCAVHIDCGPWRATVELGCCDSDVLWRKMSVCV